jgi:biotin carboxylase
VRVVFEIDAIPDAFTHASQQAGLVPFGIATDTRIVVQNYIEGAEYSVESATQDGHVFHVCITRKFVTSGDSRINTGQCVPAILPPVIERIVLDEVARAIAAVGIRNGVSHTEVKVTPDGRCKIIEIGARIAGGRITILVKHALGIDLWKCCVEAALGVPVDVERKRDGFAALRYLAVPWPGRLAAIENLPSVNNYVPIVRADRTAGDQLAGPDSTKGRVGYFVVIGETEVAVNRLADEIAGQIRVIMKPDAR